MITTRKKEERKEGREGKKPVHSYSCLRQNILVRK